MAMFSSRLFLIVVALSLLDTPYFTYAVTYYRCVGKGGDVSVTEYPLDGKTCKAIGTFEEMTDEEKMKEQSEREEKEKKRTEEYEKRIAEEDAKRKANESLEECYASARMRYEKCRGYNFFTSYDSIANANLMLCDDNHQQERNQCLQRYPQEP